MRNVIALMICCLILAACGIQEEVAQEVPEVVKADEWTDPDIDTGTTDSAEEPSLVISETINQLGNDSFTDVLTKIPTDFAVDIDGEYTYVMYGYENSSTGRLPAVTEKYLSILKGDTWVVKDRLLPVGNIDIYSDIELLGKQLSVRQGNEDFFRVLTFNEHGEISEENLLDAKFEVKERISNLDQTRKVKTSFGNTVLFDKENYYLDREKNSIGLQNSSIKNSSFDYIDYQNNIGYEIVGGTISAVDLNTNELIYNETDGQEKTWEVVTDIFDVVPEIVGQTTAGDYYLATTYADSITISLNDKEFTSLQEVKADIFNASSSNIHMINDSLHFYEFIEFKGKPSIHLIKIN